MYRNQSVNAHSFAMVPRADIPRSAFKMQKGLKTTFDAGWLVPILCEEVLPGDTWNVNLNAVCRMATPLFPVMDNLYLDTFAFFVPNRLVWTNWVKFMGEQLNPGDSIAYLVPVTTSPAGGYVVGSIFDQFGLPTIGQVGGAATVSHNVLPLRGYNLIFNEWFRDENLWIRQTQNSGDGPDTYTDYALCRRGKRKDYFTGALPFVQKGTSVSMPLGTSAPIFGNGRALGLWNGITQAGMAGAAGNAMEAHAGNYNGLVGTATAGAGIFGGEAVGIVRTGESGMYADLSAATAATINQLRQSFQIQKLLERDARGGTRYTELLQAHFGVHPQDFRLNRPEYLGGGSTYINVSEVPQTSATSITGGATPLGSLAAKSSTPVHGHGFHLNAMEHGYVIMVACVRADLTYQQGLRKHWSRSTRYDFYFPAFAMLGEQAVYNREIYCDGSVNDGAVFGYQERWAEYRYNPSEIHGLFKSTSAGTLDAWHLSQKFTVLPTLGTSFISETPPLSRVLAVGAGANGAQFLFDGVFNCRVARPLPMYSVPGLVDHF